MRQFTKRELYLLIDKYLEGKATQEEIDLLSRYYNSFQQNRDWNIIELGSVDYTENKIFNVIKEKIRENVGEEVLKSANDDEKPFGGKAFLFQKRRIFSFAQIAVAACVIGVIILGAFFLFSSQHKTEIVRVETNTRSNQNEALPGGDKATLKLADGSTIVLDEAHNGALTQQGETKVVKLNGKLNYNPSPGAKKVLYNIISTPRGGKYQIELSDGSQVWLNNASSLRFPTAFVGKERRVEITGEAYFEIVKNKAMPFIVKVQSAEVQVLGTHFNVMSYHDEASIKTTLLEGAVKFVNGNLVNKLKPGQQAQLLKTGKINLESVDVDEVIAWKNGMFHFNGADIGTVLRQLSRWYDLEPVYKGKVDELFYAQIPRNTKLSVVLKALEMTGKVHFEINGNKIIVTS